MKEQKTMAMNPKSPVKQRFAKPAMAPTSVAKAARVSIAEDLVDDEPAAEEAPVVVAILAEAAPAFEPAPPASADATALSLKALDLWSENASAFFDFARELGEAKTLGDLMETQSRFASARYDAFMRQSGEFTQLAQRCAIEAGRSAPTGFVAA
jgi:hypothetical protein